MTKPEVVKVMGNPVTVQARDNAEILEYILYPDLYSSDRKSYYVRLVNGHVDLFGPIEAFPKSVNYENVNIMQIQNNTRLSE